MLAEMATPRSDDYVNQQILGSLHKAYKFFCDAPGTYVLEK